MRGRLRHRCTGMLARRRRRAKEEEKEGKEEEAVFIRDSITNEDPPNSHQ